MTKESRTRLTKIRIVDIMIPSILPPKVLSFCRFAVKYFGVMTKALRKIQSTNPKIRSTVSSNVLILIAEKNSATFCA